MWKSKDIIHYFDFNTLILFSNKVCSSKSNLKVHFRTHIRLKPYTCKHCDYDCMHHSSIKDHLIKNHPDKPHTTMEPGYEKKERNSLVFLIKNYSSVYMFLFFLTHLVTLIILKLFQNRMNSIPLILIVKNLLNHSNR